MGVYRLKVNRDFIAYVNFILPYIEMSTKQEHFYMKEAQKISHRFESACDFNLFAWFEDSHIDTHDDAGKLKNSKRYFELEVGLLQSVESVELVPHVIRLLFEHYFAKPTHNVPFSECLSALHFDIKLIA